MVILVLKQQILNNIFNLIQITMLVEVFIFYSISSHTMTNTLHRMHLFDILLLWYLKKYGYIN